MHILPAHEDNWTWRSPHPSPIRLSSATMAALCRMAGSDLPLEIRVCTEKFPGSHCASKLKSDTVYPNQRYAILAGEVVLCTRGLMDILRHTPVRLWFTLHTHDSP